MSLYNALFGVNPFSDMLLKMLGTDPGKIPRYRDCFLNEDGTEIVIHTRTGGGNREFYDNPLLNIIEGKASPSNADLRALPGFLCDEDDDFDPTYANFHFSVPEACRPIIAELRAGGAVGNPAERWKAMLAALKAGDTSKPDVARALKVGEQIMGQINDAMKKGE